MPPTTATPKVPPPPRRHSRATLPLAVLCLAAAAACVAWQSWDMFGPARRSMLQGYDDTFYYAWLPAVLIDHSLDFSKPLGRSQTIEPANRAAWLAQKPTPAGYLPNKYPVGWALSSLPFFALAQTFAPEEATGYEPGTLMCVWCGQLLYAAAGLALGAAIVRRLLPAAPAWPAVLAVWLASPLVYYQTARVSMSHSLVFALSMAVFMCTLQVEEGDRRRRTWAALGFFCAMLVITRNVSVVYLAFPLWALVRHLRSWNAAAWLAIGGAGPACLQLLAWKFLFGSWIYYSYGGERFDFTHLHIMQTLFSPRHGWFYWHPLLLAGIAGFLAWAWRQPVGRPWVVSLAATLLLNAAWPEWWYGSSFGNRGYEVSTFFAMLGFAWLLAVSADRPVLRRALAAAAGGAVAWNLIILVLFLTRSISRVDAVTYLDVVRVLAHGGAGPH